MRTKCCQLPIKFGVTIQTAKQNGRKFDVESISNPNLPFWLFVIIIDFLVNINGFLIKKQRFFLLHENNFDFFLAVEVLTTNATH